MATAYASLVSLMKVLTLYQHPKCPVSFNQPQLQSMLHKVSTLVDFLESHYSPRMSTDLLKKMADAAFAAADMIESYYVDRVQATSTSSSTTCYDILCEDMEKAIEGMDLIINEAVEVKEQHGEKEELPEGSVPVGSVPHPPGGKAKMVGLDEELVCLMDQLTSDKSSRQVLSIVGMGGIGKTTLARNLYEHPYVKNHFHIHAWVTISQDYSIDIVIQSLLSDLKASGSDGEQLYKHLFGRRYLIVLDDIWDATAWYEFQRFFPDNNNGSRILLTTRITKVAQSVGSRNPHEVKLLDESKSWDLLSQTVFGKETCPPRFLSCGREIAKSCKGLPLTIAVVGGLLKIQKTTEHWDNVAADVNSFVNAEDDGHCLKILSLSYDHLPIHLKPCFLYMATFREDQNVEVNDLIRLWVADGFLKAQNDRILEDVALEYVNNLIERNLVMVAERGPTGIISSCNMHDLLREFCLRESHKEWFVYHVKNDVLESPETLESAPHRLTCYLPESQTIPSQSVSTVRSINFMRNSKSSGSSNINLDRCPTVRRLFDNETELSEALPFCKLLQVMRFDLELWLDLKVDNWVDLKVDIRHPVNLRYFKVKFLKSEMMRAFYSSLSLHLSLFWNLETLNIYNYDCKIILPSEFWKLSNLRHMDVQYGLYLPEPTNVQSNCVLDNLQSLGRVCNFNFSNEVVKRIPKLKDLWIWYDREFINGDNWEEKIKCSLTNLALLPKLQKLTIWIDLWRSDRRFREPKDITFSPNLTELTLYESHIPWEYCMSILASLPKLQILNLSLNAFCGDEWNSTEGGEFQSLKYLKIAYCDLRIWRAESSNFPKLMRLELWDLKLEEIPSCMADVGSLQSIYLWTKEMSAIISGKAILDERQEYNGDDDFLIEGEYWGLPEEETEFNDMAAATNNFRVKFEEMDPRTWRRTD